MVCMIKRILFSLLFGICCLLVGAQTNSAILHEVQETVDNYFMIDLNLAVENPGWRMKDLAECSRTYIEPNHFFRNGKMYTSYTEWVDHYCREVLKNKLIGHELVLDETFQKVQGNNDLYRIGATLNRSWLEEDGPDIPVEKVTFTFQWRGAGKRVYIMHLDGAIRPVQLPQPVVVPTPQQAAETVATAGNKTDSEDNQDYISDSSRIGYFFEEFLAETAKDKFFILLFMASFFIYLVIYIRDANVKWAYWTRRGRWKEPLGIASIWTVVTVSVFVIYLGGALAYKMYKGNYKPRRIRLEHLEAYDSYRLAVPHKAVAVAKDGKWGLVNFAGQVTYPLELDSIGDFQRGLAIVRSNGLYAFLHEDGADKSPWMNHITPFREGRSLVEVKQKDEMGETVYSYYLFDMNAEIEKTYTKLPYTHISFYNPPELDRYTVYKDDKYGIIDGEGRIIVPLEYDFICSAYHEGMIEVRKDGGGRDWKEKWANRKCGYINLAGELAIPLKFHDASHFSEGLAAVENIKYRVGYVDKQGNLVIPYRFIEGREFGNGRAVVRANIYGGPWGMIDTKGNWIMEPKYQHPGDLYEALRKMEEKK